MGGREEERRLVTGEEKRKGKKGYLETVVAWPGKVKKLV